VDLIEILHDSDTGGDDIFITSPAGYSVSFKAFTNDIFQSLDPGTGQVISGRVCTVSVLISDLIQAGFSEIKSVFDSNAKPWVIETEDTNGRSYKFKVSECQPDNGAGMMVIFLESYR
jgi:hypothetical protein